MPLDQHVAPERELDPCPFPGKESSRVGPVAEQGLAKEFITPEPTERQRKLRTAEFAAEYENALGWGGFLDDQGILGSDDRDLLKQYLDRLLAGLRQRYVEGRPSRFPSTSELTRLTEVVTKLARLVGIRKTNFGDLLSAMKRVENRWNKLPLLSFADALLARLLQVPMCPLSVIYQTWSNCSNQGRRQVLREVKLILSGAVEHDATKFPWHKAFSEIRQLEFPTSTFNRGELCSAIEATTDITRRRQLCYLAIMDLRRQQLEWDERYGQKLAPALNWIYLLQRQADFAKLSARYCGDVMAPDRVAEELAKQAGRDRRNESYRKHVARPRKNVRVAARKLWKPTKPRRKHR